ncbi:MAG: dinitrogenase iron-molybdenum cofactor [Candidatus Diapherotrites archaeon]|nr:dinitrogenase iron-molybdenum cofactor [Candidatus Diapherotrites archaeon]
MRVAISAAGAGLNAAFVPVFGRSPYFVIVELDGGSVREVKSIPNPAAQAVRSAGIMAAQALIGEGVNAVISGSVGPNAHMVLSQAGIAMYACSGSTVRDVAEALAQNRCTPVSAPAGYGPGPSMGYGRGFGRGAGWGRGRGWGRGGGWGRGQW